MLHTTAPLSLSYCLYLNRDLGLCSLQLCAPGADVCVRARRQMVDVAQAEERVILTCDRTFIRMGYSDQAFYVRTTNKQEQVKEVLAHFDITINEDSLLSRCAKCNDTFYPRWGLHCCNFITDVML